MTVRAHRSLGLGALLCALLCGHAASGLAQAPAAVPDARVEAGAAREGTQSFRLDLADLGLTAEQLARSDRATQSVSFRARADHVLTRAELELELDPERSGAAFDQLDVLLNGEVVETFTAASLAKGGRLRRVVFEPTSLGGENHLALRMRSARSAHQPTSRSAEACRIASGSWSALRSGTLQLTSAALPLPNDLAQLPLPFFDADFDREQRLLFVLPQQRSESQLRAAALVAGWFALQGRGRLSFDAHVGELPASDAVVFVDGPAAARSLGIAPPDAANSAGLELRANPRAPERKLLIVYGGDAELLMRAARGLIRDGYDLSGQAITFAEPVELPSLAAGEVPRWASGSSVALGRLPGAEQLRLRGGHAGTLRLGFRLRPDLFVWPREHVELDLGYSQAISPRRGPARLHVVLNDTSIGTLPSDAGGRVSLQVPRAILRGYNELLLQVSYDEPAAEADSCDARDDDKAWVALSRDSNLRLGAARNYTLLPDLQLFLYDGFPFTAQGDLRETSVLLPADPGPSELASMLSLFAHFATITGHAPTAVQIRLGAVEPASLVGRDVLTIAAQNRHPLLERYAPELPLRIDDASARAQRPARTRLWSRVITGHFDRSELPRAQAAVERGAFGAAFGLPAPWDRSRSWVVITASEPASLPLAAALQGYATSERPQNDLLILAGKRRALFELGTPRARGELEPLLALRFWLAHAWVLLCAMALVGAAALAVFGRAQLQNLARERLQGAER